MIHILINMDWREARKEFAVFGAWVAVIYVVFLFIYAATKVPPQ